MMSIAALREITEKCVRCGICQSVCPVFAELQREAAVARGKVSLIQEILSGKAEYSSKMSTYLLQCLGCGACSENCPNGVKADELILAARALMVEEKGLSLPKQVALRGLLDSVHLLPLFLRAGSLMQGLLLRKIPKESGLHLRFSLPYLSKERWIPSLQTPFFLDHFPEEIETKVGGKKIGLFVGCTINYLFPSIGASTLRLLNRAGLSAVIPKDQGCCGLPAYGSGDLETARSLARRNLKAFARGGTDQIIVPCASCLYFLREGYAALFPDDPEVKAFSEKIVEPSTFFLNRVESLRQGGRSHPEGETLRVTYHDPCHLRRGLKISEEPRRLLKSLPGVELVEMKQPDRCCGMAGSFNLIYYGLSKKILNRKVNDIASTAADQVVTSCMGCLIQLKDGLHQRKMGTKAVHLVELLENAIQSPSNHSYRRDCA